MSGQKRLTTKRSGLIAVLLIFLLPVLAFGEEEMTLNDAIRIGLQNNYNIRIARNSARVADGNKGLGTAAFLPSIDLSGGYQQASIDITSNSTASIGDNDAETWNSDISLNWTLFDGFRMFADKKRYNALAILGETQARNTIELSVVAVSRAYFDLVRQDRLLEVAGDARDISQTRLEKERVRNELGGASSTDLLNAQVAFNVDQSSFLTQELNIEIARENLNLLLGRDPAKPITVSQKIAVPELADDFESLLKKASERNSSLIVARQNKIVADQLIQSARASFMPRLSLNAGYNWSDQTTSPSLSVGDINTESSGTRVGLTLSINLFDGGRDKIGWRNARLEAKNKQLALADAQNQMAGTMQQAYETYILQKKLVVLEEQNVAAARQNMELHQDRYRLGAVGSIEFRDAQVSLIRAQTALIVARYQVRISRLVLQQLTGDIATDI
ncbi:MAG: TolC family protein [FCB group bacterium]|nr:TolC family protein [FCB group bacterium]